MKKELKGIFVLAIAGCSGATSPDAKLLDLPLRDRIVFSSNREDPLYDIYTIKLDGTDPRRLTGAGKGDVCPVISPDGNWIAYNEKDPTSSTIWYSLVLMSANGTGRKVLADIEPPFDAGVCPSWSDDSKFVLLQKVRPDAEGLLKVFNTAGDSVWSYRNYNIGNAQLSPDGSRVALITWVTTIGPNIDFKIRLVTSTGVLGPPLGAGELPSWSPSGDEILYSCYGQEDGFVTGLCGVATSGQSQRTIISGKAYAPRYSPDARTIGYGCYGQNGLKSLCFINTAGSSVGQVPGVALQGDPNVPFLGPIAWSRESDLVAFECEIGNDEICVIRPDGTGFRNVTSNAASDRSPSFSPRSGQ